MRKGLFFFFSSRRRHTRCLSDWSSDVCSSDLLAPVLLVPLLLSNFWLWDEHFFYQVFLVAQLLGYAVAIAGLLDVRHRLPKPFRLAAFLLVTLAGMSIGLWQFLRGHRYSQWNPEQNR